MKQPVRPSAAAPDADRDLDPGTASPHALDAERLCRLCAVSAEWLHARVSDGVVEPLGGSDGPGWRFDAVAVHRVRRIAWLEQHFDAVPELAALVADLEDELHRLRRRLDGR